MTESRPVAASRLGVSITEKSFAASRLGVSITEKSFAASRLGVSITEKSFAASRLGVSITERSFAASRLGVSITERSFASWRLGVRSLGVLATLSVTLAAQASIEFDVASIKRNTSAVPRSVAPTPTSGQITLSAIPARFLATRAYPDLTNPVVVEGLPAWAGTERYDVIVKFRPGASTAEQVAMWKTLLADRMKLRAHYETRPRSGYRLLMARADGRLGPALKPATIPCPPPGTPAPLEVREIARKVQSERREPTPQEEATLMSQCAATILGARFFAGSVEMQTLVQALSLLGRLDGPITDATGLQGRYAFKLWAAPPAVAPLAAPSPPSEPALNDAPSLFEALRDQLGLKLEQATIDGTILVIDHIERPTEN